MYVKNAAEILNLKREVCSKTVKIKKLKKTA